MNLQVIENIDLCQLAQAVREADRERSNIALQNKKSNRRRGSYSLVGKLTEVLLILGNNSCGGACIKNRLPIGLSCL